MDMQTTDHKWGEKRPQEEGRTNCEETSQPYFAVCWDGHTRFQPTPGPGPRPLATAVSPYPVTAPPRPIFHKIRDFEVIV